MFCSTIIPTIGRSTLSRAVESVLKQAFTADDFEIIVVNDSGKPLPEAEWQSSEKVRIIKTNRHERSIARNTGAAIAQGKYLHFLDDDDWILPGALESFWDLARNSQALLLYGGYNFVDATGDVLQKWYPDESGNCLIRLIAGEWLPIQASLIESGAFFVVGGFEPWMIPYQDNDLVMQIALRSELAVTKAQIANIVRSETDSSTNYSKLTANMRWSREKLLSAPSAFSRMRASAKNRTVNPSYWQGRVTAVYLISILWNLRRKRLFTMFSRGAYALANIALSGPNTLSPSFWRGVTRSHVTQGFFYRHGIS